MTDGKAKGVGFALIGNDLLQRDELSSRTLDELQQGRSHHSSPLHSVFYDEKQWMDQFNEDTFKILDPDDPLMKRFQDALKSHLQRIDGKLEEEIRELEAALKDANKTREDEGLALYEVQQEAARQEQAIDQYKDMLAEVVNLRGDISERLEKIKSAHKRLQDELQAKKSKEKLLQQSVESLDALQRQFAKWEQDLAANLSISQRISEKDAATERELIYQKQQKDFVLLKLEDEVWKLQSEIKDLDEQLQIKDEEKMALGQTLADAAADLEALEKEHKTLYSAWNSVLVLISQRDKINEEIGAEQRRIKESLQNLQAQVENLKKNSNKEMENNERLTALQTRIKDEINLVKKLYDTDKEKYSSLEKNFNKISKLIDQNERELAAATMEHDAASNADEQLGRDLVKLEKLKRSLEEDLLARLDDKVMHDKALKNLNRMLHETKDGNLESEVNLNRAENAYGKSLLEIEKLNSLLAGERFDLDAIEQKNEDKRRDLEKIQADIKNHELLQKQKERKVAQLNKKIEELSRGKEEIDPYDAKIQSMEKNIDETEQKIKKAQQFWLRQQGYMYSMSEQRDRQIQELSCICREIMLMEQRNYKLEVQLDKQRKEEANVNRSMNGLQHRLLQINVKLASQKELKNELEDKNNSVRNEYIQSLKNAELHLIQLQADIKRLCEDKCNLKEQLTAAQQDNLSWEKKVQLITETNKSFKEERNSGGDIALMKSEIHKMEIRLSYLRKAQEKLVQDMEFCISRRDNIVDEAMAREKKNPKNQHNQRIIMKKRLDDQKTKIKQVIKETKQIENKIASIGDQQKTLLEYLNEGQKLLRQNEDIVPDIEKQIVEAELIKHHNLEVLVRKQRRVNMLRELKDGCYKSVIKSEMVLDEEWRNQLNLNKNLNEIMEQTQHDFPLLKNQVRKILLTLET
ncbi:coiled-coil domain-containing protein 40 [Trichogramma pretiosum]|uniref:coiled-coil domain-containing protein 40 n=1 Tax=Trichogramma pretiosum TaxID=7493 RepID=UPI0006C9DEE2|nr:coiled-coil domain-containing protein 40 [Trichogramma pretiosum]